MLPDKFPPWRAAHYHFRKWRELNLLQRLCDRIRRAARVAAGRDPSPSAAVIDTQSARAERQGGPGWGRDPNKQVTGRKRHVIVDTLGLLLAVVVHPANENDAQSAPSVLKQLLGKVPRLRVIFADSGYKSLPGGLLWRCFHWLLSVVEPDGDSSGFDPLPKRWVTQAHVRVVRRLPPPSPRLRASSRNVGSDGPSGNDSPDDSPNHLIRQTASQNRLSRLHASRRKRREGCSSSE